MSETREARLEAALRRIMDAASQDVAEPVAALMWICDAADAALATPPSPDPRDARIAQLEEALIPFARWAKQLDTPPNWVPDGCPVLASPGDISDFCAGDIRRAGAALSGSSSEWLEGKLADAKTEAVIGCIEMLQKACAAPPRSGRGRDE